MLTPFPREELTAFAGYSKWYIQTCGVFLKTGEKKKQKMVSFIPS